MSRTGGFTSSRLRPLGWIAAVALLLAVLVWRAGWTGPPQEFVDREPLPSCGTVQAPHMKPAGAGVECFDAALREGRAAEVVVHQSGVEGGSIVTYYRTEPDEPGIELFREVSDDPYGPEGWRHVRCPTAHGLNASADDCRDVPTDRGTLLTTFVVGLLVSSGLRGMVVRSRGWTTRFRVVACALIAVAALAAGWWALLQAPEVLDGFLLGAGVGTVLFATLEARRRSRAPTRADGTEPLSGTSWSGRA